jgi:hypothetical protein
VAPRVEAGPRHATPRARRQRPTRTWVVPRSARGRPSAARRRRAPLPLRSAASGMRRQAAPAVVGGGGAARRRGGGAGGGGGGVGGGRGGGARGFAPPPPPLFRTNRTRRVPHPVLIGHAASLSQVVKTRAMTAPSAVATRCSARCLQSGRSSWREHGPASGRQGSRATATRPRKGSPRAPRTAGARSLGRARHRGPRGFSRMGVNQSRETSDELNDIKGRRVK